jgi:hypothetical protein
MTRLENAYFSPNHQCLPVLVGDKLSLSSATAPPIAPRWFVHQGLMDVQLETPM